jgi:hypothetical protein
LRLKESRNRRPADEATATYSANGLVATVTDGENNKTVLR